MPHQREIERACLEAVRKHWRKRTEPYPVEMVGWSDEDTMEFVRVVLDAYRMAEGVT